MSQKFHRVDYPKHVPEAFRGLYSASTAVHNGVLGKEFLELIFLRVSQINGCAFCLDMHTADARKGGETERRLCTLSAWRETPFFTPRERAALAWAESLTLISQTHASDEDYALLNAEFSAAEQVDLSVAIATINSWNRLAVGFRKMPK